MNNYENELLDFIVTVLEEKKAKDIKVLNVKDVTFMADYFIICNGSSTTHIKAIADELEEKLKTDKNIRLKHEEGYNSARWILMDYGDIIVHIFHEEDRMFYNLEKIWTQAKDVLERGKGRTE